MSSLLEVIALNADDARAAAAGGADRLEVVSDIAADGLTPTVDTVAAIRDACDLRLRVMLRDRGDFDPAGLSTLADKVAALAAAGADGFVFGFLTPGRRLDIAAMRRLADAAGLPWTCHRAIDAGADYAAQFEAASTLPGLDQFLSAGSPDGVDTGIDALCGLAGRYPVMAGGGLRLRHIGPLRAAGITAFHVGSGVRDDWAAPVRPDLVARWRTALDETADLPR